MVLLADINPMRQGVRDGLALYRELLGETLTLLETNGWGEHVTTKSNPHEVHKDQLYLFLLNNYPIATPGEAQAGMNEDRYLVVSLLKEQVTKDLIDPPAVRAPVNGSYDPVAKEVVASEFTVFSNATHTFKERSHRFQKVENGTVTEVETITVAHTGSVTLPSTVDQPGRYFWQCQDHTQDGTVSKWSWPLVIEVET